MSEITSDSAVIAALRRQMTVAVARQAAAAGNLANIDTPGYQAQEADFGDALDEQAGRRFAAAHQRAPPRRRRAERTRDARSRGPRGAPRRQQRAARSRAADDDARGGRLRRGADRAGREVPPGALRHQRGPVIAMSTLECRHHRQRQRARRRAHAHRGRRLEHGQRRVDARRRRPAVPPPRRRARRRRRSTGFDAVARPAPARSASRSPASSRTRRRSAGATSRRIPTPTPTASSRCRTSTRRGDGGHARRRARLPGQPHRDRPDPRHGREGARARRDNHGHRRPRAAYRRVGSRSRAAPGQPAPAAPTPAASPRRSGSSSKRVEETAADANTRGRRHARQARATSTKR